MIRRPPLLATLLFLTVSAAICALVYVQAMRENYAALAERAEVRLAQHNDRFLGQISRFQQLANTLSRHPWVTDAVLSGDVSGLPDVLLSYALATGAQDIFVVDASGTMLVTSATARSGADMRPSQLGHLDYMRTALDGGLGWSYGLEERDDPRTLYFSRAIFSDAGPVIGAVAVTVAAGTLEFEWSFSPEPVAYFDRAGIAFIANRPELALRRDPGLATTVGRRVPEAALVPIFAHAEDQDFGHRIWRDVEGGVLPRRVLVLDQYLPRVELTGYIFQSTRAAEERALLLTALAALSLTILGLLLWAAWLRRRSLARQLQLEEAANVQLEARVAERTAELRETQDQLIAVSRLSALGEMSAGISHELNQPLAAIRNFAENGRKLIDRGQTERAAENFELQMTQVDRIGRIIRSLRAFARNEPQEIVDVDLSAVAAAAVAVSDMRLGREGVTLEQTGFDSPVMVRAGAVRLQQVIVNILGNAIDALECREDKRIRMSLDVDERTARLAIADNGSGIIAPERVFDPFYSTKDPGGSSGMGLGLSISHGIVGSFGGTLTCRNRPEGGAEFVISLPLAGGGK